MYFQGKKNGGAVTFLSHDFFESVASTIPPIKNPVYVYNLPFTVSADRIREALEYSIGVPDDIQIFDIRKKSTTPKDIHAFHLVSPINAIIRFDSDTSFNKACMIENKLFGILCHSSKQEGSRQMFLEPAHRKRKLVFSCFPESMTLSDFTSMLTPRLHALGLHGELKMGNQIVPSSLLGQLVSVQFPSFETALHVHTELRSHPVAPGILPMFISMRTKWNESIGEYTDAKVLPRVYAPFFNLASIS